MRLYKSLCHVICLGCVMLLLANCSTAEKQGNDDINNKMKYASQISIWEHDYYNIAEIKNPWDTTKILSRYILVSKDLDVPTPVIKADDIIIKTPIESALVYTSVHAGALKELGNIDIVKSVVDAAFYKIPEIISGLENGTIIDAGNSDAPITERVIDSSPEAIFMSIYQGMDSRIIDKLGIPQIKFTDNFEQTPLGRAEWIRFFGMLTDSEEVADSIFSEVEKNYTELTKLSQKTISKPKIMVENMYQGIWYVSGGNSYQARMIKDAGGNYAWGDDTSTGSLNLSFEQVLDKAFDADIWLLKVFGYDLTYDKLKEIDIRNTAFNAVESGGVYYANTAKVNLFEEFPYHPDLLLKDYIKIFHPDLLPDYSLRYFKQMTN